MKDTTRNTYLAVDFGGGSGRVIAGSLLQGKLELEEIHRFTNRQVKLGNHVYWDFPALFEDMKTCCTKGISCQRNRHRYLGSRLRPD